jgi:hypothetical protein
VVLLIAYPRSCSLNVSVEGASEYKLATHELTWYGVDVRVREVYVEDASSGELVFALKLEEDCLAKPHPTVGSQLQLPRVTLEYLMSDLALLDVMYAVTWYFIYNMIAVLSYISLYIMLTYGLAKVLGGGYVKFPFPV